jgi:hypothetical protein
MLDVLKFSCNELVLVLIGDKLMMLEVWENGLGGVVESMKTKTAHF